MVSRVLCFGLGLVLLASSSLMADDFVRVRPGSGVTLAQRPRRGQREVLHRRGEFVDMVATASLQRELRGRGYRLEMLQPGIDENLASLRRPGSGGYHRHWEIRAKLTDWEERFPEVVTLEEIGHGGEVLAGGGRREILAARLRLGEEEGERPRLLLFAGIHARELSTSEVVLFVGDRLLEGLGRDRDIEDLLRTREIWLLPCLNPDGREYCFDHDPWWRKNRTLQRSGHVGVDLNRNFAFRWGPNPPHGGSSARPASGIYRGEKPFSEPESRALRDFVRRNPFAVSIALHSYGEMILQPFGYARRQTLHPGLYQRLGEVLQEATGYRFGPVPDVLGYFSNGRHDDWLYADHSEGKSMVAAVELEIGKSFFPPISEARRMAREIGDGMLAAARLAGADLEVGTEQRSLPGGGMELEVRVRNLGIRSAEEVQLALLPRGGVAASFLGLRELGTLPGLGRIGRRKPAEHREVFRVPGPPRPLELVVRARGEAPVRQLQSWSGPVD